MRSSLLASTAAAGLALLVVGVAGAADTKSSASTTKAPAKGAAKGTLPDPALLDGSAFPADKKSETGMIGDFELPGDENARTGKVGGPQIPMPMPNAGGVPGLPIPMGGGSAGLPSPMGGAGLPIPSVGGATSPIPSVGGGPDLTIPNPLGQQGGAPSGADGQQGGTAEGRQVSSLGGEGGGPELGQISKPQVMGIGDPAMQIKTAANAPSVVGGGASSNAGQVPPQQSEGKMGSGGKGAVGSGANKGAERGRAIPAGL